MKFIKGALVGLVLTASSFVNAGLIVNIAETSDNVEMSYSGSINLNALLGEFNFGGRTAFNGVQPSGGNVGMGGFVDSYNIDLSLGKWLSIGSGGFTSWDTTSGDAFAMFSNPLLGLVAGYESGDSTSGAATKLNESFASLGMMRGSYLNIFSNGNFTDTILINVGPQVLVSEPATLAIFTLGAFGLAARRFKKQS
jgi:hypothetical protein